MIRTVSFENVVKITFLQNERKAISAFIIISTSIFVILGKPKELLLMAGLVNGFILPFALSIMLIAGRKLPVLKQFKYPIWIEVMGWMVVAMMGSMSIVALIQQFG